jgi:hypothetical protein
METTNLFPESGPADPKRTVGLAVPHRPALAHQVRRGRPIFSRRYGGCMAVLKVSSRNVISLHADANPYARYDTHPEQVAASGTEHRGARSWGLWSQQFAYVGISRSHGVLGSISGRPPAHAFHARHSTMCLRSARVDLSCSRALSCPARALSAAEDRGRDRSIEAGGPLAPGDRHAAGRRDAPLPRGRLPRHCGAAGGEAIFAPPCLFCMDNH